MSGLRGIYDTQLKLSGMTIPNKLPYRWCGRTLSAFRYENSWISRISMTRLMHRKYGVPIAL